MATIRVGQGFFKKGLQEALNQSRQGDTILIDEGVYELVDGVSINRLKIVGNGDRENVVLRTNIRVQGETFISNLTIEALPYKNALYVDSQAIVAELDNVILRSELSGKYPAIYDAGTALTIRNSSIFESDKSSDGTYAICLEKNSKLFIENSEIGSLSATSSNIQLIDCSIGLMMILKSSTLRSYGKLISAPAEGLRSMVVSDESNADIASLFCASEDAQIILEESVLTVRELIPARNGNIRMWKKGRCGIQIPPNSAQIIDSDEAERQRKKQEALPREIIWNLTDAKRYDEVIAPRVRPQDTIVLAQEGNYYLPKNTEISCSIYSAGRPEKTILNGMLYLTCTQKNSFRGFTMRPSASGNAIYIAENCSPVRIENLIIEDDDCWLDDGRYYPALYLTTGSQVSMHSCQIVSDKSYFRKGTIISENGNLIAENCDMGWVSVTNNSTIRLKNSKIIQVWLEGNSHLYSEGNLTAVANECQKRILVLEDSEADIERIEFEQSESDLESFVDGSILKIGETIANNNYLKLIAGENQSQYELNGPFEVEDPNNPTVTTTTQEYESAAEEPKDGDESYEYDADASEEINKLTGLAKVKEQISAFLRTVKFNQRRIKQGLSPRKASMHSLFMGSPGTGKTTVARLLGQALYQAGAIRSANFVEVQPNDFLDGHDTPQRTEALLEKARGGVLFVDEAYGFYKQNNNEFAVEALNMILTFMENNRDDIVVIFAGYETDLQKVIMMNDGLESRFTNHFTFENYSGDEIAEIGYQQLISSDYELEDEDLYRKLCAAEYSRSVSPANARWVREFFNSPLLDVMEKRVIETGSDDLTTIIREDLHAVAGGDVDTKQAEVEKIMAKLDSLVGLEPVKEFVRNLLAEAKYNKQFEQLNSSKRPAYHMLFTGNPGTGKTTVAKLIAELFYNLDILQRPTVKRVTRSDLVGRWIGHTEEKTRVLLKEAMGGVLFVDEAYQLSKPESPNDFGADAVEVLMDAMAEQSDKFVAIFAGYTNEMRQFLEINPGLTSRVTRTIEFPDYSPQNIAEIVNLRLSDYIYDKDAVEEIVAETYAAIPESNTSLRANGRWAERFVERVESRYKTWALQNNPDQSSGKQIPMEIFAECAREFLDANGLENTQL